MDGAKQILALSYHEVQEDAQLWKYTVLVDHVKKFRELSDFEAPQSISPQCLQLPPGLAVPKRCGLAMRNCGC